MPPRRTTPPTILDYARKLRGRLWALHAVRGALLACGIAGVALVVAAQISAPVLSQRTALWVALVTLGIGGVGMLIALWPMRAYTGLGIARRFAEVAPGLESRVRSALEMLGTTDGGSSPELVQAHVARVERELSNVPPPRVAPRSLLAHATTAFGLAFLALTTALVTSDPRLLGFARSLFAPAPELSDGTRVAPVVKTLSARLTYPSYLGREPVVLVDPTTIDVPRGTSIELSVMPLFPSERGTVQVGSRTNALSTASRGMLSARLTAHESGKLVVRLESDGVRYEDAHAREMVVTADAKPKVTIDAPTGATLVELQELVTLRFSASDDGGIAYVDMHVRLPDGSIVDRRIWSAQDDGGLRATLRASTGLTAAELGVREGDVLVLWLEARDGDLVTGPNIGMSDEITIEVTSPRQRIASYVPLLQAATDAAVMLLGDRLEREVPEAAPDATERFTALAAATRGLVARIDEVVANVLTGDNKRPLDVDQLQGIKRRVQRLLDSEAQQHATPMRPHGERKAHDTRTIEELEKDVILLSDLLGKAHIDEAGSIAKDLRDLKKRIEELLKKLGDANDPDAERQLMAEIARAQQRLAELKQSLSRMATRVPSEFVNREALKAPETQQTLQDLQSAIKKRDLKGAAEQLEALAKQIDDMAQEISEGGMRMRDSRFGPRDQAMAAARQQLDMLADQQQQLADNSQNVMQGAMSRSGSGNDLDARAKGMAQMADGVRDELGKLDRGSMPSWQSDATERANERMRDARDALAQGDLAGARNVMQGALRDLQSAAADMQNDARMFPGANGETARNAEAARNAADRAGELARQIEQAMPDLSNAMTPADRQRLQRDVEPQRATKDATDKLRDAFEKGPGGVPLSPDGVESLEKARDAMQRAERALQRGQADEASREQADAAEKLSKLSERLAKQQQQQAGNSPGQENGDGESGDGRELSKEAVDIPDADEFKGPLERRRRLLDAMREASPQGFEAAVQRYYQELLR